MKRQYRGFSMPLLVLLIALIVTEIVGAAMTTHRGPRVSYAQLLSYIQEDKLDAVALQGDIAYALRIGGSVSTADFSSASYDLSAVVPGDFVHTCIQLTAEKKGVEPGTLTELDLPFNMIYWERPSPPWYS